MTVWSLWFAWPEGQVWPNLVAAAIGSAVTGALVAWRALRKLEQQHAQHRQALAEDVSRQLADHHAAVLAAVAGQHDRRE